MDLSGAQEEVDKWIKSHGVRYFSELTNMAQQQRKLEKLHE